VARNSGDNHSAAPRLRQTLIQPEAINNRLSNSPTLILLATSAFIFCLLSTPTRSFPTLPSAHPPLHHLSWLGNGIFSELSSPWRCAPIYLSLPRSSRLSADIVHYRTESSSSYAAAPPLSHVLVLLLTPILDSPPARLPPRCRPYS
jgi:hypothetical protein